MLVVLVRVRFSIPLDEHRVGNLFRSDALLPGPGDVVEEKRLDDLDRFVAVDLEIPPGQAVDLAYARFIGPVFTLELRLDGGKAGVRP